MLQNFCNGINSSVNQNLAVLKISEKSHKILSCPIRTAVISNMHIHTSTMKSAVLPKIGTSV